MPFTIERLSATQVEAAVDELIALLQDTVASGASIGFTQPPAVEEACAYWAKISQQIADGTKILLAAYADRAIAGTVQLEAAHWANGMHRAEVQKLMVHRRFRQQGIGRALMIAIEAAARDRGRTLLVLDTKRGDTAESLYLMLGYTRAGVIPHYAMDTEGELRDTVIMYREL